MDPYKILSDNLELALDFYTLRFQGELRDQGHKDTGKLEKSFKQKITLLANGILRGEIFVEDYGIYQNYGVKAENIRYNPFWLIPWAKRKRPSLSQKEIVSFVFAVWQTHKKEGMPSRGSFAFSKNGFRTGWLERVLKASQDDFNKLIAFDKFFSAQVDQFIKDLEEVFN